MAPIGMKLWGNAFQTILQKWSSEPQNFFRGTFFGKFQNFESTFTLRGWLRSAWNFGKTRFRRFCNFDIPSLKTFSEAEFSKISKILKGRLPLKHSSDRPQTLPTRVSDDPRHFIFRRIVLRIFCELWRCVYPPRMAPIGLELGQNAFQMIPNISSFDP